MTSYAIGSLVCGGKSSRMGTDKLALVYGGVPQVERLSRLFGKSCATSFVLCRREQATLVSPWFPGDSLIFDPPGAEESGTLGAIARAIANARERGAREGDGVLVMGCDMPLLEEAALAALAEAHDSRPVECDVTCFLDAAGRSPEPLASVWSPSESLSRALDHAVAEGMRCPRRFLVSHGFHGLKAADPTWILNANTPEDHALAQALLRRGASARPGGEAGTVARTIEIRYFAQLREASGRATERYVTHAADALSLWLEVQAARGLPLSPQLLRVAINDAFAPWDAPLADGDAVAFLPPVAGG